VSVVHQMKVEGVFCELQLHQMALHDCGVLTLARLSVNTVVIRKQLFASHSVMKYHPVDCYKCINQ